MRVWEGGRGKVEFQIPMNILLYIYTHIYIHIYLYIYVYIYIYTNIQMYPTELTSQYVAC